MKTIYSIIALLLPLLSSSQHLRHHHLVTGCGTGELYISTWVVNNSYDTVFKVILHSNDNGQTLSQKNKVFINDFTARPVAIFPDSECGVIYKQNIVYDSSIVTSFDTGLTFVNNHIHPVNAIASGFQAGELIATQLDDPHIYRSVDYGNTFDTIPMLNIVSELLDYGSLPGELYFQGLIPPGSPYPYLFIPVARSSDYGTNIQTTQVPILTYWCSFDLRHGTEPGEYYLLVFFGLYEDNFDIYHVTDYGANVTFQSNQESYGFVSFTSGKTPGVFYYSQRDYDGPFLYIHYSTDYGVTFESFTHIMDPNYNGIYEYSKDPVIFYPNPAKDIIHVSISENMIPVNAVIKDICGSIICEKVSFKENKDVSLDVSGIPPGIYILTINFKDGSSRTQKIVIER